MASEVSKQTEIGAKYFLSIFVDRANHQPCVIFSRAPDRGDPYVQEPRHLLGWPGQLSHDTSSLESTTSAIDEQFNTQKALFFIHIKKSVAPKSSDQAEDLKIGLYDYRSTVERVIQVFLKTEALLLETTFAFRSEAGRDASSMLAVDAHVVVDDAAYKSGGRQKDIHERVTTTSTDDVTALQASKDGITYIRSAREHSRYGRQADETKLQA